MPSLQKNCAMCFVSSSFRMCSSHLTETFTMSFHCLPANITVTMVISTTATTTTTTTTTTTATITSTVQAQAKTWPNYVYNILQLPQPLQNLWLSLEYPGEDDVFLSSFQVFQWSARLRLLIKTYQNYLYHSLSFSSMEWHGMAQMRLVAMSWSVSSICSDVPKSSSPILLEIVLIASWKVWSAGSFMDRITYSLLNSLNYIILSW